MGQNWVAGCARFSGGELGPIEHKVVWAKAYLHTKWHLSPSSRLATMDIGRKLGAEAYLRTKWYPDTYSRLATIDMGRKLGGSALFQQTWT